MGKDPGLKCANARQGAGQNAGQSVAQNAEQSADPSARAPANAVPKAPATDGGNDEKCVRSLGHGDRLRIGSQLGCCDRLRNKMPLEMRACLEMRWSLRCEMRSKMRSEMRSEMCPKMRSPLWRKGRPQACSASCRLSAELPDKPRRDRCRREAVQGYRAVKQRDVMRFLP